MGLRLASLEVLPDTCAVPTESETRRIASWLRRLADDLERGERRFEGIFVLAGGR